MGLWHILIYALRNEYRSGAKAKLSAGGRHLGKWRTLVACRYFSKLPPNCKYLWKICSHRKFSFSLDLSEDVFRKNFQLPVPKLQFRKCSQHNYFFKNIVKIGF